MAYGSHPDSVANFRLIQPDRDFYFFGDDIVVHTFWEPIELVYIPRSGIEGLLIGLDQNVIECLDWSADDIRFYFLNRPYEAQDIKFTPHPPELNSTNVQDAIEELLDYTVTQAGHVHPNLPILNDITDQGSGKIITDAERTKLQGIETGATRDQIAIEVPFEPDGDIGALNVQDAIEEVRNDTNAKLAGKSNVGHHHPASDIDGLSAAIASDPAFHTHANKPVLDQITSAGSGQIITDAERTKLAGIEPGATTDQTAVEVPITDAGNYFPTDNVEAALQVLGAQKHTHLNKPVLDQITAPGSGSIITVVERNKLAGIETGATADQIAAEVPFTPSGDITSTNVQAAIQEVRTDAATNLANKTYHASEIGFSPDASGMPMSTDNVQEAIENLDIRTDALELQTHTHANKAVLDQISTPGSGQIITALERAKLNSIEFGATQDQSATEVPYSNAISGLSATNVQAGIDEVNDKIEDIEIVVKDHNLLNSLQGGNVTERYHLTELELQGLTHGEETLLHHHSAESTTYDPTVSTISADNVQEALDELAAYTKEIGTFGSYTLARTSDQSIPSAAWTGLQFNLVAENTFIDQASLFTLQPNGEVVFNKKGKYELYAAVAFDQIGFGTTRAIKLEHMNQFGSDLHISGNNSVPVTGDLTHISTTNVFDFNKFDRLKLSVFQDSGTPLNCHTQWTELTIKSGKDYTVIGGDNPDAEVPQHPHQNIYGLYSSAGIIIGGNVVKLLTNEQIMHASNNDLSAANEVLGVAVQSGTIGSEIKVIREGYMMDTGWSWTPHQNLFLGLGGQLTQTYTKISFMQRIGRAISPTEILIRIMPPIT